MGIKSDIIFIGAIVGGLVLFKDQIGGAFAKAGESIGGAFGDLFEGISGGFNFESEVQTGSGTISGDSLGEVRQEQIGDVSLTSVRGGNLVSATGGTEEERTAATNQIIQEQQDDPFRQFGSFLKTLPSSLANIFTFPEAGAEESNIRPEGQEDNFPPAPATEEEIAINTMLNTQPQETQIKDVQTIEQPTRSLLPTDQQFQTFSVEGSNIVGGTVFENPVDTLSEILKFFPDLSASQAADLLNQFETEFDRPVFPSDIQNGLIDPDVKNIVAAGGDFSSNGGEQIDTVTTFSELQSEEQKAACITCDLYGLNCDICKGG